MFDKNPTGMPAPGATPGFNPMAKTPMTKEQMMQHYLQAQAQGGTAGGNGALIGMLLKKFAGKFGPQGMPAPGQGVNAIAGDFPPVG